MRHLIPVQSYVEGDFFAREMRGLRDAWHYAALGRDLARHQDWVLVRIADQEVVVQNFDGELRAFTNTCPHRFNAIRTEDCGNSPLTCGYHRWTFDREGTPVGIPFRHLFRDLDLATVSLTAWDVALRGELVFVRPRGAGGPDLAEWLGALGPRLDVIAGGMAGEYARFSIEVAANWKLVVQNTLEFDHVYSVHPETFGAIVESRPRLTALDVPLPHVGYRSAIVPKPPTRAIERRVGELFARSALGRFDEHEHIALFPTTSFGVFRGESISILRFIPRGPGRTTIDTRLFLPRIDGLSEAEASLLAAYAHLMEDFARKLGEEDRLICESVQRGAANLTDHRGALGEGERIVAAFQRGYDEFLRARVGGSTER